MVPNMKTPPAAYALEITGKDILQVKQAASAIAPGTPINIAFLGNEDHAQRIHAARVIRACGFEPVPIISARRLGSERDLDRLMEGLCAAAQPSRFIFVGGDPATPAGPWQDSLALLQSGVVARYAIRQIGITGYPEGHPRIDRAALRRALRWKHDFIRSAGCAVEITTQFGFDTDAVIRWIEELRGDGIDAPVRVGIPGPADAARLLRFARQFGVSTSARIVKRYGLSLAGLMRPAVAECFCSDLEAGMEARDLGVIRYHLYPFGGLSEGVRWMNHRFSFP